MKYFFLLVTFIFLASIVQSQPPYWVWAKGTGGSNGSNEAVKGVTNNNGDLYITGTFSSQSFSIESYTLTNMGMTDIFVMKYDKDGNVLWVKSFGGYNDDYATGIAADSYGDIYITGYHNSPNIDFGSFSLSSLGGNDIFITKLDSDGTVIWSESAGGNSSDVSNAIAIDLNNDIFITGNFGNTGDFGGIQLQVGPGLATIFLAKYNSDGNALWALASETDTIKDYAYANDIATDNEGNVYICGELGDNDSGYHGHPYIRFGNDTIWTNNIYISPYNDYYFPSAFVAKFSGSGSFLMGYSDDNRNTGNCISVDANGNIYQGQYTQGEAMISLPSRIFSLVKISSMGELLWRKSFNDSGAFNTIDALHVTESNDLYACGTFSGWPLSFETDTLAIETYEGHKYFDIFIVKYDSNGNEQWIDQEGGKISESVNDFVFHSPEQIYVLGSYESDSLILGANLLTNESDTGHFEVHVMEPWQWRYPNFLVARMSEDPLGIVYTEREEQYNIYPCPASEKIILSGPEIDKIEIYDIRGASLILSEHSGFPNEMSIDISDLSAGIYFVTIYGSENIETKKLIIE